MRGLWQVRRERSACSGCRAWLPRGHEVHGMTRSESNQAMLDELGAMPVLADALERDPVTDAVGRTRPDVLVHQLTAIGAIDPRHFDRSTPCPHPRPRVPDSSSPGAGAWWR